MTKRELIQELSAKTELKNSQVEKMLNSLAEIIVEVSSNNGKITLPKIGTFSQKHRTARMVRNPRNGEKSHAPAKHVPSFKAASYFKDQLL